VGYTVIITVALSMAGIRVVRQRGGVGRGPAASTSRPTVEQQITADQQEGSLRLFS